jgi:hypothetical protein
MKNNRLQAFKKKIPIYRKQPVLFCQEVLQFYPDPWQEEVLNDIANSPRVSVRSGQGVGKTGLEASVTLWFLSCFPYPKVVATAPTRQQLHDVLWAEINKWQSKSHLLKKILKWTKTKIYMRNYEERWFATARTATKPENMQGFHEDYMLFIVDEASGVADPIMEAILGTLSGKNNKLLMCGNPTRTSGTFYDSHNRDRADYKTHKVSSLDSPRTSKENIEMLKRKYNEGSDVYRVRVLGDFPKAEADTFIPLEFAEGAVNTNLKSTGDVLHLGVDVSRYGDDETVIAPRIAGKVFDLRTYGKTSTTATTGYVLSAARDYREKYPSIVRVRIKVDDSGVGGGVTDELTEAVQEQGLPYEIIPINNGSSSDDDHYDNKGTETWATVREALEENFSKKMRGEDPDIELPDDDKLISQLTTRKYKMTSKGKIVLERKEDMKKRGLSSPDRADAVVLAFVEERNAWIEFLKEEYGQAQQQSNTPMVPESR